MLPKPARSKHLNLFLSSRWLQVFLLVSSPALILLGNRDWLFNLIGYIDPWLYLGFFLHYDYPSMLVGEKKIARLPWILPGFVSYKLFGPVIANYILHWCYLVSPPVALYFIHLRFFQRWIGFTVATLMLFFTPLWGPAGWDWNGGGSGFFYLTTFLAVSIAAERNRSFLMLVLATVLYAIMIHANLLLVNLTPLLILQYLCIRGEIDRRDITTVVVTAAASFCIVTAVLGLINLSVGRQFWFSSILFDRVADLLTHPSEQRWWQPWSSGWLLGLDGTPLCLIAACCIAATVTLVQNGWRATLFGNPALSLQLQLVVATAIYVAWQALGQTALQPWYMAVPLAFPAFLSLGGLLHINCRHATVSTVSYAFVILLPLFGVMLLTGANFIAIWPPLDRIFDVDRPSIPLFVFYVVSLLPLLFRTTWLVIASSYLLMVGSFLTLYSSQSSASFEALPFGGDCAIRQRLFVVVESASIALREHAPHPKILRLWWNDDRVLNESDPPNCRLKMQYVAQPLLSTGFLPLSNPWPRLPKLEKLTDELAQTPASILAVFGTEDDKNYAVDKLRKLSSSDESMWKLTDQVRFDRQGLPVALYFLERRTDRPTGQ
jgi:hypothetical protein